MLFGEITNTLLEIFLSYVDPKYLALDPNLENLDKEDYNAPQQVNPAEELNILYKKITRITHAVDDD